MREREGFAKKTYKQITHTESDVEHATVNGVDKAISEAEGAYDSVKRYIKD